MGKIVWYVNYISTKLFKKTTEWFTECLGGWRPGLRGCAGRNKAVNYLGNWNGKDITAIAAGHRLCRSPRDTINSAAGTTAITASGRQIICCCSSPHWSPEWILHHPCFFSQLFSDGVISLKEPRSHAHTLTSCNEGWKSEYPALSVL